MSITLNLEEILHQEKVGRQQAEYLLEAVTREFFLANDLLFRMGQYMDQADDYYGVLNTCVKRICHAIDWPIGHIYKLQPIENQGMVLLPTDIWHLDEVTRYEEFKKMMMSCNFRTGEGLPGRILDSGQSEWIPDMTQDAGLPKCFVDGSSGVKAGFGFPIYAHNEVSLVLTFFHPDPQPRDERLLVLMGRLSEQMTRELERKKEFTHLRIMNEALEREIEKRTSEFQALNTQMTLQLSARQQLEGQLVQSEKMASLGQMAAGVAHEINNPIGFVMSNLGTLTEYINAFRTLDEKYALLLAQVKTQDVKSLTPLTEAIDDYREREDFTFILNDLDNLLIESREGMERIKEIVQNLKSFARVDEAEEKEADINECLRTSLKIVWNELKYKCEVETDYGELLPTYCFPGQLNQVFMNLLVNASHAIHEHGVIRIKTELDPSDTDPTIVIKISDTGSGIPPELLGEIFNPFFTTKPVGKGTGLGLSIVYGIIERHRGIISVESEVGQGTTFTIRLPIQGA